MSQAIDALQKIATRDDEPRTLRRRMMTNATDGVEMRRRGVIPSTRYLARYDEMLRMLASGRTIMAIAEHYGLSRQHTQRKQAALSVSATVEGSGTPAVCSRTLSRRDPVSPGVLLANTR